ncbi:MAG: hypothetical protein CVU39_02150 [Chloroflexi bacterium HGW-Chloroflexi-10]|jgi:DNA-binding NarL/FixJ family response regulator|nr:MAG: hypothetical protein CVU39_02150 [Chloroflexi bacterium HGW-Chloroflexi-10]
MERFGSEQKILIASINPLFTKGIERLLRLRNDSEYLKIRTAKSMQDILVAIKKWEPNLVILDYDNEKISPKVFFDSFIESQYETQLLLLSLNNSETVSVYERNVISFEEATNWLESPGIFTKRNYGNT